MSFDQLNLSSNLLKAVKACGFKQPTEVQSQAIPLILSGQDVMASAQTGTGKTGAFVLPALERLRLPSAKGIGPRVLVLTPTRELAAQVTDNVRQFSRFIQCNSATVVGGLPYGPQIKALRRPLDVLVATPGRLLDHMEQGHVDYSRLQILVLDEADRMLDMGFVGAVKTIAHAAPKTRQTLLFSATLEGQVLAIAKQLLKQPVRVQLATNKQRNGAITQHAHRIDDGSHKQRLLSHYLNDPSLSQAVIFTATKRGADRLSKKLTGDGHSSAALHGDMNQNKRKRTIDQLRRGNIRLLVATDVAARGLDVKGISHVINYDMPMVAEDYIHRIGRTGRAGAKGTAISLVSHEDRDKLASIQRLTGGDLDWHVISGLEPTRRPAPSPPSKGHKRKAGPHKGRRPQASNGPGKAAAAKPGRRRRKFNAQKKSRYSAQAA